MKLPGEERDARRDRIRVIVLVGVVLAGFIAFQQLAPQLDIEGWLEDIAKDLGDWTYLLVGFLAFGETGAFIGLVFPGETAVIIGGALAGQGENSVVVMIAVVWFCAWAGDSVSFLLGSKLGRRFVLAHGPKLRITEERFTQVERYFERHGGKTILIGRFIGLVRALAPFIAGSSGMQYRAFLPYSVLGTGLWGATFTLLGFFISESINEATELASRGLFVFGSVVVAIIAAVLAVRYMRVRANRQALARRLERYPLGAQVVAFGRRIEPQARFLWRRLTPGTLGLEFTSVMAVLAVALFVFVGYAIEVGGAFGPSTPGDERALELAADLHAGWLVDVARAVSVLGSAPFTLALALALAIVLYMRGHRTELAVLVVAVAIAHVVVPLLKEVVDRPRPPDGLVDVSGLAYPSGHATYAVLYSWIALTVGVRLGRGWGHASAVIAVGVALTVAIGLSRIYLQVHWWSDVAGGWALGASTFAACAAVAMVIAHLRQNHGAQ